MTAIIKRWDTGSPRGEPNYWMVSVNDVVIWKGYNGAESKRIENIVREACELVVQPQRPAVPDGWKLVPIGPNPNRNSIMNEELKMPKKFILKEAGKNTDFPEVVAALFAKEFSLTPSELRALTIVIAGVTIKGAAKLCNLSVETLKAQRRALFKKLEMNNAEVICVFAWKTALAYERAVMIENREQFLFET